MSDALPVPLGPLPPEPPVTFPPPVPVGLAEGGAILPLLEQDAAPTKSMISLDQRGTSRPDKSLRIMTQLCSYLAREKIDFRER